VKGFYTFGFNNIFGSSGVATQLEDSQEGHSSMG
jgi:hypothetical protein